MATSEDKVKAKYPHAEARTRIGEGWGIFFEGRPRLLGIYAGWSGPDAYGNTASNAWVNAAKQIAKESTDAKQE